RLTYKELDWQFHPWLQELSPRPKDRVRNLDLLVSIGAHEAASATFGIEELHHATFEFQVFQFFLWAEVRLPETAASHIDQLGLHDPAHLGSSDLGFHLEDFVNLSFDADNHSLA